MGMDAPVIALVTFSRLLFKLCIYVYVCISICLCLGPTLQNVGLYNDSHAGILETCVNIVYLASKLARMVLNNCEQQPTEKTRKTKKNFGLS